MNKRKTMSKKLLIFFIAATIIGFAISPARAVDFPHNEQSMIGCDSCHDVFGGLETLMPPWVTFTDTEDSTIFNELCWSCHNDMPIPFRETHSSYQIDNDYGDWRVQCKVCHWPHDQQNLTTYGSLAYITSGNSTGIAGTVLTDTGQGWSTNEFQGMLLVPDTGQFDKFMYRIESNTNTTITVDPLTPITNATGGEPYAVI
jgi:hypothetical protein